ncbi:MAG: calcium/sodium antiporter [Hyphomonadaceae bacterium]
MEVWFQIGVGLLLLGLGGEGVVRGAVGVARRLGVSELLIGLTLVGFGTSTPEILTSVSAALRGSDGVALGNVVGSNVSNILLIAALAAIAKPIAVTRAAVFRDGSTMVGASLALVLYALCFPVIERWAGAMALLLLFTYLWSTWRLERQNSLPSAELHRAEGHAYDPAPPGLWASLAFALGGIALLVFGADQLVQGAVTLARRAGLSETVIGLTIVAVGTSLPELVATLAAAAKGRSDVAFGNVVGSNIYNVLGVIGVTALIRPVNVPLDLEWTDWLVFAGSAALLVMHAWTGLRITRREGGLMLAGYLLYIAYLVGRVAA